MVTDCPPKPSNGVLAVAKRQMGLLPLVVLLVLGASSCAQGEGRDEQTSAPESVRGIVVEVEARSIRELRSLKVKDEAGAVWEFDAAGFSGSGAFTPSHLREHGALGEQVTVRFHREGGVLKVDEITD